MEPSAVAILHERGIAGTIRAVWSFQTKTQTSSGRPSAKAIIRAIFELFGILCVLIALGYFFLRGGNFQKVWPQRSQLVDTHATAAADPDLCGPPSQDRQPVPLEIVYSEGMRPFIEPAADRFLQRCPNIQVKVTAAPDIEAADAIFDGRLRPVLWAPTDELSLRYLNARLQQRGGQPLYDIAQSISLAESPLVLLIWQDRLRLLSALLKEDRSKEGDWARGLCALVAREPDMTRLPLEAMVPGDWADWYASLQSPLLGRSRKQRGVIPPSRPIGDEPLPTLEETKTWGRVKIGHASPTRDSAGLAALYLLAYDYLLPPNERAAPGASLSRALQEKQAGLSTWLRRCEAGLYAPPTTAQSLTAALFNAGPSLYDGVVTYEYLALPFLDRVDSHADTLRRLVLIYPKPLLLARYPAVLFPTSPRQQDAARRWLRFLKSKEMQELAILAGFRPVNPEVTIADYRVEQNQFLRLRRYGVLAEAGWVEAPRADGSLVQKLITLWGESTGRN